MPLCTASSHTSLANSGSPSVRENTRRAIGRRSDGCAPTTANSPVGGPASTTLFSSRSTPSRSKARRAITSAEASGCSRRTCAFEGGCGRDEITTRIAGFVEIGSTSAIVRPPLARCRAIASRPSTSNSRGGSGIHRRLDRGPKLCELGLQLGHRSRRATRCAELSQELAVDRLKERLRSVLARLLPDEEIDDVRRWAHPLRGLRAFQPG